MQTNKSGVGDFIGLAKYLPKRRFLKDDFPSFISRTKQSTCTGVHNILSNFVSKNIYFQTRSITVREPSGRLRKAAWEERDRMNFIYFPKPGRKYEMPELLKDERLEVVRYFVLFMFQL